MFRLNQNLEIVACAIQKNIIIPHIIISLIYMSTPNEDLMKEHGLLNRLLLIYEEIINRLQTNIIVSHQIIHNVAKIIRTFIEDHHEKTEELYIFPLLINNNMEVELVNELIEQHKLGRIITDNIMKLTLQNTIDKTKLIGNISNFIKMYRYHESREDTIIFPKFRGLSSDQEYKELGEKLEEEEDKIIGYSDTLQIVTIIEKYLGIFDLKIITNKVKNNIYV